MELTNHLKQILDEIQNLNLKLNKLSHNRFDPDRITQFKSTLSTGPHIPLSVDTIHDGCARGELYIRSTGLEFRIEDLISARSSNLSYILKNIDLKIPPRDLIGYIYTQSGIFIRHKMEIKYRSDIHKFVLEVIDIFINERIFLLVDLTLNPEYISNQMVLSSPMIIGKNDIPGSECRS